MEYSKGRLSSVIFFLLKNASNKNIHFDYLNQFKKTFGCDFLALFSTDYSKDSLVNIAHTTDRTNSQCRLEIPLAEKENPLIYNIYSGSSSFIRYEKFTEATRFHFKDVPEKSCFFVFSSKEEIDQNYYLIVYSAQREGTDFLQKINNRHHILEQSFYIFGLINKIYKYKTQSRYLVDSIDKKSNEKRESDIKVEKLINNLIIGTSPEIKNIRRSLPGISSSQMNLIIRGETGTGKDLIAQAIVKISTNRKDLIVQNCAAIPDSLLEAELFGYKKGAFSGAEKNKKGLIAQADGAILFLDEIGDMPMGLQAKLLRVIQEKCYRPLGDSKEYPSDFRLITATHQNIESLIQQGKFRQDLFYRLQQLSITLPPLRKRKKDIKNLAKYFLTQFNQDEKKYISEIHEDAIKTLKSYDYPGNIRELKTLVYRAGLHAKDRRSLEVNDINHAVLMSPIAFQQHSNPSNQSFFEQQQDENYHEACKNFERQFIQNKLRNHEGNKTIVAKKIGLPLRTLTWKCKKLGISA